MGRVSKETGVVAVLVRRMVEQRLPRALALKERVGRGELLNDLDLLFLEEVMRDAASVGPIAGQDQRLVELARTMAQLYSEITSKALENEKKKADS